MFHNVVMKKSILLVVLLNGELHYNFFYNHIRFFLIARQFYYIRK